LCIATDNPLTAFVANALPSHDSPKSANGLSPHAKDIFDGIETLDDEKLSRDLKESMFHPNVSTCICSPSAMIVMHAVIR
jgi:hypothetical protein